MATISELTRKDLFLDLLKHGEIQGRLDLISFLTCIWPLEEMPDPLGNEKNLKNAILRHVISNPGDWEPQYLWFDVLKIMELPDHILLHFLTLIVNPEARVGEEQTFFVDLINERLQKDGFRLEVSRTQSGYPFFRPVRITTPGAPVRILVFACLKKPPVFSEYLVEGSIDIPEAPDYLQYRESIPDQGLLLSHLVEWWAKNRGLQPEIASTNFYQRLRESLSPDSPPEHRFWDSYFDQFGPILGPQLPALLPQVWMHYDPKYEGELTLNRQRMDFLMLLPYNVRVVLEVDGRNHYAEEINGKWEARPDKYAMMVSEDRKLRLRGYEIYRFGGSELQEGRAKQVIKSFFEELFVKNGILVRANQST